MMLQPHRRARTRSLYWALILCNVVAPQLLWFQRVRANLAGAVRDRRIVVNVGMWLERFVIVVTSLHRDFLPSSWGMYYPTFWDWATFIGTHRPVPDAAVPVHPLPADDLDLRDAHAGAGGGGRATTEPR